MGLLKSFVDSFFVFWAGFIMIMIALDIRAIILRELPPLINYYYAGDLLLRSPYEVFFQFNFRFEYVAGLIVLIISSILLGILTKSSLDVLWDTLIYTILITLFAISIDKIVVLAMSGTTDIATLISQIPNPREKAIGALLVLVFAFAFILVGRSYAREKEEEPFKEIEL